MEVREIHKGRFYRHADGGLYRMVSFCRVKIGNGEWRDGVLYEFAFQQDSPIFSTDLTRFCERFKPEIPDDYEQQIHE